MNKNIRFKTSVLRSDLCDHSDAYIASTGRIDRLDAAANENDKAQKNIVFKNDVPFRSYVSKINSTLIDNAEDLDIVMPMYNLLEYSQNYYVTSESLLDYQSDETDAGDSKGFDGKSFRYGTKLQEKHYEDHYNHPNQIQIQVELNRYNSHNHQYQLKC